MNYKEYFNLFLENNIISEIWSYVADLIYEQIKEEDNSDNFIKLLIIYFSLIDDGNTCMCLDKSKLHEKWENKLNSNRVLLEDEKSDLTSFEIVNNESLSLIDNYLYLINEEMFPTIIGKDKMLIIDNGWLYLRKYHYSRKVISKSIDRLFNLEFDNKASFDYLKYVNEGVILSDGQKRVVENGVNKNLVITGGPGTGKTTSILFLLLSLLTNKSEEYNIYLVAPSGKASSKMKESIINSLSMLTKEYKEENEDIIRIVAHLEESTIHRLLAINSKTGCFTYNKDNQFNENSIFIIDEASMIDICLFASLLQAIPAKARVFIMGDKNQLPSVECGSVFADLLKNGMLNSNDNIVTLDESHRFNENTKIYTLAKEINEGLELSIRPDEWKTYNEFKIEAADDNKPIFYYYLNPNNKKEIIKTIVNVWSNQYYKQLQSKATNLDVKDIDGLEKLYKSAEIAKILCGENEGYSGVKTINTLVKEECIDKSLKTSIESEYAGQLMMIRKNNKTLDLYNGDTGISVTLKDSNILYFMTKKKTNLINNEGYRKDRIFKINEFVFYPFRMITRNDIELAYAITIHKSQGSDYENILVVLPSKKGHPLLNRQIVYTAITRTKGNTYILSSQQCLQEAKDNVLIRDTNINIV